jgi:hypothetical protein
VRNFLVRIVHAFSDMMSACSSTAVHERAACTERNDQVAAPAFMVAPCTSQTGSMAKTVVPRLFQGRLPRRRRALSCVSCRTDELRVPLHRSLTREQKGIPCPSGWQRRDVS